ncbi:MAG TPA: Rieske (2Fe-2S) protein, partial [Alphaproteobacteria bacterium]|nr:Rieske (2Fe-2S) protein [Alphaproteobacteria bacterium]
MREGGVARAGRNLEASPAQERLARLIARYRPGFALDQAFYNDPEIYRCDLERFLFRHWLCVGHASRIPDPGDYFLFDVAEESVIIVRRENGSIGALANVCRHRGSRVRYEAAGHAKVFVCPYHGWGYNLDGSLRAARHMPEGFERSAYGLKSIHLRLAEGLIFVNLSDAPIGFEAAAAYADQVAGPYGWA